MDGIKFIARLTLWNYELFRKIYFPGVTFLELMNFHDWKNITYKFWIQNIYSKFRPERISMVHIELTIINNEFWLRLVEINTSSGGWGHWRWRTLFQKNRNWFHESSALESMWVTTPSRIIHWPQIYSPIKTT